MTSKDNIIYYIITAVVFIGIVVCSLLLHNAGQSTNGGSGSRFMTEITSTIVVAFSAFITAGATVILAVITKRYVQLTQDILKATNTPEVILFFHYGENSVNLCVQNIGTGYASDIKFTFTGDRPFKPYPPGDKALKELEPYKNGIDYLGCGHKIETFLFSTHDTSHKISVRFNHPMNITVTYKDSANTEYNKTFTFEFQDWENVKHFISQQNGEVTNELKKIANILQQK